MPFTSVHSNLEHGLAILTEALVHSNLSYTTSLVEVQSRSVHKATQFPFISCTLKLDQTGSHWPQLVPNQPELRM